jgi:uncharacterized protein GlcG (DUF336 family)
MSSSRNSTRHILNAALRGEIQLVPSQRAWRPNCETLHVPLNLRDANELIGRAHAKASELGIRVTVAVVDEGAHLIAIARMDGAAPLTPQVAEAKAVGAAMLHRDGASLGELAKDRPGFFSVADRLVRVPIVPGLGSVLIKRDGKVLGAVGVSGGRPEQDLECAEAGISST